MIIKRCGIDDIDDIYNIEKNAFADPLKKETVKKGLENENSYYYALYDPCMVGFISYEKVIDEGQIISVAVHEKYRRKGYAKKLFEYVLEEAKRDGINIFTLEVRGDNKPAIALYEALGFKRVGMRKAYYTNPVSDAILMDLQIGKEG